MAKRFTTVTVILFLVVVAITGCPLPASPLAPAEFYQGKTINLVVPHTAGNAVDLAARTVVPYLSESTGANVIVSNMEGASGLEGINYIYRTKPDGLTLGLTTTAKFVPNKVLDEPAADYELEQFSYIMSIGHRLFYFMVSTDGPYQSILDLQEGAELKLGGSSPSGPISLGGLTVIKFLGLDAKVITGIRTEEDRALATKRGEIAGYVQSVPSARSSIDAGLVKPIFVITMERDSLRPDIPTITELVDLSQEDLALVRLWETAMVGSTLIFSVPGIPADRLAFLRNLAEDWTQSEAFHRDIDMLYGYEVKEYLTGEEVAESMQEMAGCLNQFQVIFADLIEQYRA